MTAPIGRELANRVRINVVGAVREPCRLNAVDMRPLKEALDHGKESGWTNYYPLGALVKGGADRELDKDLAKLRESLDRAHESAIEEALQNPPPATVQAYEAVYGRLPDGWPPGG